MRIIIHSSLRLAIFSGIIAQTFAAVDIEYVTIGNAGNVADARVMNDSTTGYGSVAYTYKIAKNETTISQYAEFLNAVAKTDTYALYSTNMSSQSHIAGISRSGSSGNYIYSVVPGSGNKPITYLSWFDAARFCNWMHNGQPDGLQTAATTEDGAYTLNGVVGGVSINRTIGATVWIPSENEWYKAAFYDPTKGDNGGYWLYPTQHDTIAGNTLGVANSANYWDGDHVGYPGAALTDGGAYGVDSDSFYGTNDQAGNVWEWNDAVIGTSRGLRGGSWDSSGGFGLMSSDRYLDDPAFENFDFGLRVASIPETSCLVLTIFASGMMMTRRKR